MLSTLYIVVSACFLLVLLQSIRAWINTRDRLPKELPWVGLRRQMFAKTRASFRASRDSMRNLREGYEKYSKVGKSFVMPLAGFHPVVLVPKEHARWLIIRPEKVCSAWKTRIQRNALSFADLQVDFQSTASFVGKIVRNFLRNDVDYIQPEIFDGVRTLVDSQLGKNEDDWQEIHLHKFLNLTIARTFNQVFLGAEVCQDEKFFQLLNRYQLVMGLNVMVVGQVPPFFFRPLFGFFFRVILKYCKFQAVNYLTKMLNERMSDFGAHRTKNEAARDYISRSLPTVYKDSHMSPLRENPRYVAEQLLVLNFAANGAASSVATNVMLDLLSSSPKYQLALRQEAADICKSDGDISSASALKKLILTESAIRESLRLNPQLMAGSYREVMSQEGITLPEGVHVPKGTWLGIPFMGIHKDKRFYPDPDKYDPYRFMKGQGEDGEDTDPIEIPQVNDAFFAFGFGVHACPGRWYAAMVLKTLISYLVMHYDFEPLNERPKGMTFGDTMIAAVSTRVKVRRRKGM